MEASQEYVRSYELPLLRAAFEVLRIRMFEVETDQVNPRGSEVIREEGRPIPIREAAEIPKAPEGPGLRRRHRRTGEPRGPLPHRRPVVPVTVDHRDRSLDIRFHLIRHRPVQIGHEDGREETFLKRDRGGLVRGNEDPAGPADFMRDVRTVPGHRNFLPSDDLSKARFGNPIPTKELVELNSNRLVLLPGEDEIFQDLFVERLPGIEFHPNPRGAQLS